VAQDCSEWSQRFFSVMLSHNSLANYYTLMFALVQHHKYSLTEVEDLIPFELDIYVAMLESHLETESERQRQQQDMG